MLAAARSLHRAGVVHGDLAARNILVDATDPVPVVSTTPLAVRVCLMLFLLVLDLMPEHELRGGKNTLPIASVFVLGFLTADQVAYCQLIEKLQWHFSSLLVSSDLLSSASYPPCAQGAPKVELMGSWANLTVNRGFTVKLAPFS